MNSMATDPQIAGSAAKSLVVRPRSPDVNGTDSVVLERRRKNKPQMYQVVLLNDDYAHGLW
jgi:hypothetical protein